MSRAEGIPSRYHTPAFKLEFVKEVLSGKSPHIVDEAHNDNQSIVRNWDSPADRMMLTPWRTSAVAEVLSDSTVGKEKGYAKHLEYRLTKAKVEIAQLR